MRFEYPLLLWLLLIVPPGMVAFFWWAARKRQSLLAQFIQARLLPGLLSGLSPRRQILRFACLTLAVAALIVALARPQWGFAWEEVKRRGLDIVLAVDTSRSMLAEDIAPNRLARAKLAAMDLLQLARSDRLGLVAFAGVAYLQCPLTFDDSAFRQSLDSLDVNLLPQGGTALAAAIQSALPAFREGDNHKVLVLLTDGEDQEDGAEEAARAAAKADVRIFTIGIGSSEGEVLRARDESGRVDYVRDDQGNVVKSRLNEDLLQKVAAAGNGFYLRLQGSKTMELLYENGLAPLPRADGQEKLVKRYHERFYWPLSLGILLLLLEILIPEATRKPRPGKLPPAGFQIGVALLLFFAGTFGIAASPSRALRDYKSGNYEQALKEFQELQQKNQDPRLHFNAGAAAYRQGKLDEAIEEFGKAANAKELDLQEMAYYNRGNSRYYLGTQTPDPKARSSQWQQSLQDFESALKLNPKDQDALFNRELVKKQIEELKQQQQQQQQNQQNQEQNQDQKDQQQQNQQQKNQDGQKDQKDQQQAQSQDQQQTGDQQNQPKPDKSKGDQQQAQAKPEPSQDEKQPDEKQAEQSQAKPAADEDKSGEEKNDAAGEQTVPGQMTREQAQRLLDAQKADEKLIPMKPEKDPRDPRKPRKDW